MKKQVYNIHDEFNDIEPLIDLKLYDSQLNGDFTERVMDQIRTTEILPASGKNLSDVSGMLRSRRMKRSFQWGSAVVAAAGVAAILFLGHPAVPEHSLSNPIQNMFIHSNAFANDIGLRKALELGVVQQANIEVSDQGYTFYIQEVIADPTRMVLTVRITDEMGKSADEAMTKFNSQQLQIRNEDGREIGKLQSILPMDDSPTNGELNHKYMVLNYIFPDEEPGDIVVIHGDVHELAVNHKKEKTVTGDWSFSYEADMTKAKNLSVTTKLDDIYTTPDGLIIEMDQLVNSPAGVRLEFNTSLSDKASALTPEEFRTDLGVIYHFESERGEELTSINSHKNWASMNNTIGFTLKKIEQTGKLHWTYYFKSLPNESERVRFVLDGYYIPVESDDSIKFRPQELQQKPAVIKTQGDILNVHDFEITEIPDEPGISGWMNVSGEFTSNFEQDKWIVHDDQGRVYNTIFRGAFTIGNTIRIDEGNNPSSSSYLIAKGMDTLPKEITLTRIMTGKRYTNVDWSFELPEIKRIED